MKPFEKKSDIGLLAATRGAYSAMPKVFYGSMLARRARKIMQRPECFADSVLRKLRLLREMGEVDFECMDRVNSLYRKL